MTSFGQIGGELVVFVHVDLEVLEVARVDADDLALRPCSGALDLLAGVRLDQHGHAETRAPGRARCLSWASSNAATMSSTRSAPWARASEDLVVGDDEVLAQHRDVHGGADLVEIV